MHGVTMDAQRPRLRALARRTRFRLLAGVLTHSLGVRTAVERRQLGLAVNQTTAGMPGKRFDLLLHRLGPGACIGRAHRVEDLAVAWDVSLDEKQRERIKHLPAVIEVRDVELSSTVLALKSTILAQVPKTLLRLHQDMVAAAHLIRQSMPDCVSVAHCVVADTNVAERPGSRRHQSKQASVSQFLRSAIPTADEELGIGFDVSGVSMLSASGRDNASLLDDDGWESMVKQLARRLDEVLLEPVDTRYRATR